MTILHNRLIRRRFTSMFLCFAPCILVGPAVVVLFYITRRIPFPLSNQIFQGSLLVCLATVPISLAFGFRYVGRSISHPILRYLFILLWIVGGERCLLFDSICRILIDTLSNRTL